MKDNLKISFVIPMDALEEYKLFYLNDPLLSCLSDPIMTVVSARDKVKAEPLIDVCESVVAELGLLEQYRCLSKGTIPNAMRNKDVITCLSGNN